MKAFRDLPSPILKGIRVLAADVDDTITTHGKIPPGTLEAFQALERAGVVVVLVTGRPAGWAQALAGYLPGVRMAIAENGLVCFDGQGTRRDLGPPRSADFFTRLGQNGERVRHAYALDVTPDDAFRLFERAFIRPARFDSGALLDSQRLVDTDFEVMASSIHIHVRPSGWGKAEGLLAALEIVAPDACAIPDESIVFVGDSSNDRSMFARLRKTSVGVRNVTRFLDELGDDRPAFVTDAESAQGFAEVARALVAAKVG
jgi:hydroxymethylpyrimidine pyrophosphatase-like HAD family hydrolase